MTVEYPLRLFLDCSTAHLSPAARAFFDTGDGLVSSTPYGWFVYANEEPDERLPPELGAITAYARSFGAEYINFDCDASKIGDLPVFDWSG